MESPKRLSLALVCCAVLGAMGLFNGYGAVLAGVRPPPAPTVELPARPDGFDDATWASLEKVFAAIGEAQHEPWRQALPARSALGAVNVVSAFALFSGALFVRLRHPRGRRMLLFGLSASTVYAVLALGVHAWGDSLLLRALSPEVAPLLEGTADEHRWGVAAMTTLWLGVGVRAFFGFAQLGFYLWASRFFRRPQVSEALGG